MNYIGIGLASFGLLLNIIGLTSSPCYYTKDYPKGIQSYITSVIPCPLAYYYAQIGLCASIVISCTLLFFATGIYVFGIPFRKLLILYFKHILKVVGPILS